MLFFISLCRFHSHQLPLASALALSCCWLSLAGPALKSLFDIRISCQTGLCARKVRPADAKLATGGSSRFFQVFRIDYKRSLSFLASWSPTWPMQRCGLGRKPSEFYSVCTLFLTHSIKNLNTVMPLSGCQPSPVARLSFLRRQRVRSHGPSCRRRIHRRAWVYLGLMSPASFLIAVT